MEVTARQIQFRFRPLPHGKGVVQKLEIIAVEEERFRPLPHGKGVVLELDSLPTQEMVLDPYHMVRV